MRLLICGSRDYPEQFYNEMKGQIERIHDVTPISCIIEGGARGADAMARRIAKELSIPFSTYKADWKQHGDGAGPIRNQIMLDEGKPDMCYAFSTKMAVSPGTDDMTNRCQKAGVKTLLSYLVPVVVALRSG